MPDLMDFLLYCFKNSRVQGRSHLGKKTLQRTHGPGLGIQATGMASGSPPPRHFKKSATLLMRPATSTRWPTWPPISYLVGNQTGEGWFLTAEMLELIHEDDTPNIVCTQPFACLPNHIVGKGVIKELRHRHPSSNIVAIDYDPGASEVNQLNRIKLMLSTAYKNLERRKEA